MPAVVASPPAPLPEDSLSVTAPRMAPSTTMPLPALPVAVLRSTTTSLSEYCRDRGANQPKVEMPASPLSCALTALIVVVA